MKLNRISLAAAAACGLISSTAMATSVTSLTPAQLTNNVSRIYMSGATAQDSGVLTATVKMCAAGTLHRYSTSNNTVFLCESGTSGVAQTYLAVHKFSVGGSGVGVAPVNNPGTPLGFLRLENIAGACTTPTNTIRTLAGISYTDVACPVGATVGNQSFIGISDVEPAFFGPAAGTYNNLKAETLATVIFGVPVTANVYRALQTQQGLVTYANTSVATDVSEANMPTMSQAEISTVFAAQNVGLDWTSLLGITIPGDNTIYIARRVDSSGTQKTFEGVIARTINGNSLAKSCQTGVDGFSPLGAQPAAGAAAAACNGSNIVVSGSGGGDVVTCMTTHNAAGRGAIGVLTTETVTTAASPILFVKTNGYAPNDANVTSGVYRHYADASLNTPLAPLNNADHNAFLAALKLNFAVTPVVQPFGNAGLMTLDVVTGTAGGNPWSRLVGGNLNNCQEGRKSF